uniref:HTH_48 domain-containing protein n=1 Tax=Heterorhabditis bacteriophora TaxID=37862 RepID=A0A1I7X5U8_HETBA
MVNNDGDKLEHNEKINSVCERREYVDINKCVNNSKLLMCDSVSSKVENILKQVCEYLPYSDAESLKINTSTKTLITNYQIKNWKKQIRAILLYEFKMGCKVAEIVRNINQAFSWETVKESTARHWFRRFRNGDESLEEEESHGHPLAIDDNLLRAIVEADPHKTT